MKTSKLHVITILTVLAVNVLSCIPELEDDTVNPVRASVKGQASAALEEYDYNLDLSVAFESGYWRDVFKQAKKEKKAIFVYGYAAWCVPCRFVNEQLLTDERVVEFFNLNYVNLKFEMESISGGRISDGWEILDEYSVPLEAYPVFIFFNDKGEVISYVQGVPDAEDLLDEARSVLDEMGKKTK